jgi:hypothetical protein
MVLHVLDLHLSLSLSLSFSLSHKPITKTSSNSKYHTMFSVSPKIDMTSKITI